MLDQQKIMLRLSEEQCVDFISFGWPLTKSRVLTRSCDRSFRIRTYVRGAQTVNDYKVFHGHLIILLHWAVQSRVYGHEQSE